MGRSLSPVKKIDCRYKKMGTGVSKAGEAPARLNVTAISNIVHLTRDELLALMKQCRDFAGQTQPFDCIDRENFLAACEIVGLHVSDTEILDKLFTLFDATGEDLVAYQTLVAAFAMVIRGNMAEKVHFAIQLYDVDVTNKITSQDLLALLTALSECMDFFGDLKVPQNQIVTVVDGIFADYDQESVGHINIADSMAPLTLHPVLIEFSDKAIAHAAASVKQMGL